MDPSQSYIPLARKYRPATFTELVGQDATSLALANAIKMGREPHSVIFSGVRGVGKTTSARLYAKALNCKSSTSSDPCNQCESCQAINQGIHEDVIEIDGASNTGVDDVRALRETVAYVPQRSRFKVYIIDEVHMLSQSAFNALLKTLEEPPAHVIFVFATTELQKIPQTIMSRCQVFLLKRLELNTIRQRITHILTSENIPFEEKAVTAIAREGHGSMRDALTLLDHVIAYGGGQVTSVALEKIISHVSSTSFIALLEALVNRSSDAIIKRLDQLEQGGVSMQDVAEKTATIARHAFIARDVGTDHLDFKALGLDDEEMRRICDIGLRAGPADLNRIFRTLAKSRSELDGSILDRFVLENYCLEWCLDPGVFLHAVTPVGSTTKPMGASISAAHKTSSQHGTAPKISKSSPQLSSPPNPHTSQNTAHHASPVVDQLQPTPQQAVADLTKTTPTTTDQKAMPPTWRELVDIWKKHKPLQAKRLEDVHPVTYSSTRIELVIPGDSFLSAALLRAEEQKKLKDAFTELFGFSGTIVFSAKKQQPSTSETPQPSDLPETLASIQQRESIEKREKILVEAQNDPLTKDTMSLFNATIESIDVNS